MIYQIGRSDVRPGFRGGRVRVEQRLDGTVAVRFGNHYLSVKACQPQPKIAKVALLKLEKGLRTKALRAKAAASWMKHFDLQKSPPLWAIVTSEQAGVRGGVVRGGRHVFGGGLTSAAPKAKRNFLLCSE